MSQITERYLRNLVAGINGAFEGLVPVIKAELTDRHVQGVHFGGACLKLTIGDRTAVFDETGTLLPEPAAPLTEADAFRIQRSHPLLWAGYCRGELTAGELLAKAKQ